MEYTFKDWLEGKPEPSNRSWKLKSDLSGTNPVYLEIAEAKANTFNWSLEGILTLGKSDFTKKVSGLTKRRKIDITEKMILDSKKYFESYEIDQLIYQHHPKKFEGIDGKKYLEVKQVYEAFQDGLNLGFIYLRNDFLQAILHFELNEFYQDFLQNDCKNPEPIVPEQFEKGESASVKYLMLDHFFTPNEEFSKLLVKDQEHALRFIIGIRADSIKKIRNNTRKALNKTPSQEIAKPSIDRYFFLLEKIKKGIIH